MTRRVIKVQGAKELDNLLKQLPQRVAQRALVPSLRSGANIIRDEIRARAPDGPGKPHPQYGELRTSIVVTIQRRARGWAAIVHTSDAFWARWIEYGRAAFTVAKKKVLSDQKLRPPGTFFGRSVKAAPAQPFVRPAFDEKAPEALKRLGQRLGERIELEAEKLAKTGLSRAASRRRRRTGKG